MSFFSELGAGIRAAAKEYNDIKQEFVTIKDDVTTSVKGVADEASSLANGAKQAVSDTAGLVKGAAKDSVDNAKNTIGGKGKIQ